MLAFDGGDYFFLSGRIIVSDVKPDREQNVVTAVFCSDAADSNPAEFSITDIFFSFLLEYGLINCTGNDRVDKFSIEQTKKKRKRCALFPTLSR